MSFRVFTHLFRVSLASGTLYSSQWLHMEVNNYRNYHNINTKVIVMFSSHFQNMCVPCALIDGMVVARDAHCMISLQGF
jgi:hypothetical protein